MAKKQIKLPANMVTAVIYILIGVLFCAFKQAVVSWAMLIVGVLFLVKGIMDIVNKNVTSGVIYTVIGALLIILRFTLQDLIVKVFGIILAVTGLVQLFNGGAKKLFPLLSCILSIVGGLLIVFFTGETLNIMFIVSGVIFIIDGVLAFMGKSRA